MATSVSDLNIGAPLRNILAIEHLIRSYFVINIYFFGWLLTACGWTNKRITETETHGLTTGPLGPRLMWNRSGVGPLGPIKPLGPGSPGGPFNPGGPSGPGPPNTTQRHMSGLKTSIPYMSFSVFHRGVPGGPGRPGGPGKNTGDVRSFSRVICRRTSALFDSRVILNQDAGNSDWGQREICKNLKSWSIKSTTWLTRFTIL